MFTSLGDKFKEIDEYWDKENKYIKTNGIYTKEEIAQILEQHEEIRRNKKKEILERFDMDMDFIEFEKEQLEFDREQAEMDLDMPCKIESLLKWMIYKIRMN